MLLSAFGDKGGCSLPLSLDESANKTPDFENGRLLFVPVSSQNSLLVSFSYDHNSSLTPSEESFLCANSITTVATDRKNKVENVLISSEN